jgi:hypothetical protein
VRPPPESAPELYHIMLYRENYRPIASHWQTLPHNVVSSTSRLIGIRTHSFSGGKH